VISLALFGLGLAGYASGGFPGRVAPEVAALSSATMFSPWRTDCEMGRRSVLPAHPIAGCGALKAQHNVILLGDSHAVALSGETMAALQAAGYGRYVTTFGGCPAVGGLYDMQSPHPANCDAFARAALNFAASVPDATLILALRWTGYVDGHRFDNGEGGVETGDALAAERLDRIAAPGGQDDPARRARVVQTMVDAITAQADRQPVILVYPIPEAGWNVSDRAAKLAMFGALPASLTTSYARYLARNNEVIAALDAIDHQRVFRVRPDRVLCNTVVNDRCLNALGTRLFYADDDHLTQAGAALVTTEIMRRVRDISAAPPDRPCGQRC